MKKVLFSVVIFFMSSLLFAQNSEEKAKEILFRAGDFPLLESFYVPFIKEDLGVISKDKLPKTKVLYLPTLSLDYMYYNFSEKNLGLGFSVGFGIPEWRKKTSENVIEYDVTYQLTILAKTRYIMLKKEKIRLFGELGLGFSWFIARNRFNPMLYAGKFTPIGIMFGSKDIFGSAELSLGSEGSTLVVGCGWRF